MTHRRRRAAEGAPREAEVLVGALGLVIDNHVELALAALLVRLDAFPRPMAHDDDLTLLLSFGSIVIVATCCSVERANKRIAAEGTHKFVADATVVVADKRQQRAPARRDEVRERHRLACRRLDVARERLFELVGRGQSVGHLIRLLQDVKHGGRCAG